MKYLVNSIIILVVSMSLLACDDRDKAVPQIQEEVYNFRDEKYQDFYSRLAREVERKKLNVSMSNNSFDRPFDKKYINEVMGIELKDDIFFKLHINRVEPNSYKSYYNKYNHFNDKNDVLNMYRENEFKSIELKKISNHEICKNNFQIDGLFCLYDINGNKVRYYYFPLKSRKISHINQSLDFFCEHIQSAHGEDTSCTFFNFPDNPYNLDIYISFSNPNDFFHIIEYVEKYIHNATGKHIWQTSLNKN